MSFRDLVEVFMEADPEDFGDFILDIAEAYIKSRLFEGGLPFLEKLIHSEPYSAAPAVWLQYAECLQAALWNRNRNRRNRNFLTSGTGTVTC